MFERRALAADVLLTGLQRHPRRRAAGTVDGHTDDAARRRPHVPFGGGEEAGVRPAVPERHAEALRGADDHVGAHRTGRGEQDGGEQVDGHRDEDTLLVAALDERAVVVDQPARARLLEEHRVHVVIELVVARIADDDRDAERLGAGAHHVDRLRVAVGVDVEGLAAPPADPVAHRHRLGGRRRLVEQRGVRELGAGQVGDHGLEVEERLEPALGDLGLVRRVGGIPAGVLQDVALDDGRRDGVRVAHPDERSEDPVAVGDGTQPRERGVLGRRRGERQRHLGADAGRHGHVDQLVEGADADGRQHVGQVRVTHADVTAEERVVLLEVGEGFACAHRPHLSGRRRMDGRWAGRVRSARRGAAPRRRAPIDRMVCAPELGPRTPGR